MLFLFFIDVIMLMPIIPQKQQWGYCNKKVSYFPVVSSSFYFGLALAITSVLYKLTFLITHT